MSWRLKDQGMTALECIVYYFTLIAKNNATLLATSMTNKDRSRVDQIAIQSHRAFQQLARAAESATAERKSSRPNSRAGSVSSIGAHKRKAKASASRLSHSPHTMPPRRSRQAATQASSPVPIQTQRQRRDDTPEEDKDIDIEDAIREAQGSGSVKQLGRCKDRRGPRPRPRPHPNPWLTTAPRQMPATPRKRKAKATATADEEGNDAEVTPKKPATLASAGHPRHADTRLELRKSLPSASDAYTDVPGRQGNMADSEEKHANKKEQDIPGTPTHDIPGTPTHAWS